MCTNLHYNMYTMKYKNLVPKIYKIAEARREFSAMLKKTGKTQASSLINKRDKTGWVVIDVQTARKYLPKEFLKRNEKEETGGEKFVREATILRKKLEKKYGDKPKENISGNIDKIVYGI